MLLTAFCLNQVFQLVTHVFRPIVTWVSSHWAKLAPGASPTSSNAPASADFLNVRILVLPGLSGRIGRPEADYSPIRACISAFNQLVTPYSSTLSSAGMAGGYRSRRPPSSAPPRMKAIATPASGEIARPLHDAMSAIGSSGGR